MTLDYEYIAYIDEAGDPGLNRVQPTDPNGASEWLTISAIVIRAKNEPETVEWVKSIRKAINARQGPNLHFRKLSDVRKTKACATLAELPVRAFCVCSNKKNMRRHNNPRASKIPSQEWFYNWCIRLVLERVSDWCKRHSIKESGAVRRAKVIFSERGGHSYSQTKAYQYYIGQQSQSGTLYLQKRDIKWDVLDWSLMESQPHHQSAGLQLADIVASAFYQAADAHGPRKWNAEHAKQLYKILPTENGSRADYSVALQPYPHWKANLSSRQQAIFEYYGYSF